MLKLWWKRFLLALLIVGSIGSSSPVARGDETRGSESGESREHRTIELLSVGASSAHDRFLVIAGVHGNETLPPTFVRWLQTRVAAGEGPLASLGKDVAFDFVPVVNPDGYLANTRYNAAGVNLNRNFGMLWGISREPAGAKAFSEPETRFVRDLVLKNHYTAAADMHGYMNWVVGPSAPSQVKASGVSPDSRQTGDYLKWVSTIRDGMDKLSIGYQFKTAGGLGDGGAFEDFAYWQGHTFAVSVEIRSESRFDGIETGDAFLRYEAFLASTFKNAMTLKNAERTVAVVGR